MTIVANHWDSKSVLASVVPVKGASNDFAARRICAFLRELGLEHADLVLRSDQEPAIVDLLNDVSRKRAPAKSFLEQSPVGESQSNGMIERRNWTVEGQIRVLKDVFETRNRNKITADHPVLSWLVEFAAVLVNRYEVGHDGKTPCERLRGKQSRLLGLEFGELSHFRRHRAAGKQAKLDVSWEDGVFLGYRTLSGETIVGTLNGVMRTRTVRRELAEERWSAENLRLVTGVPWQPAPGDDDVENTMPSLDLPVADWRLRSGGLRCERRSTSRGGFTSGRRTLRSLGGLLGARAVSRRCAVLSTRSTEMHVVRGCRKRCRRQMKGGAGTRKQVKGSRSIAGTSTRSVRQSG